MNIRPYQVDGVELFLSALDGTAPATRMSFDDPGLGKTVMAAEAYNLLPERVAVIVCPAGLRQQWKRHLERHCGRFVFAAKSTAHTQRDAQLILDILGKTLRTGPCPALVVSHENMTACAVAGSPFMRLLERGVVLTLDEAHRDKGAKTKRGRATRDCCKIVHAGKGAVWPMTATPMPASPLDLWVLLTWVGLAEHCFSGGGNDPLFNFITHFGGGVCPWTKRWVFPAHVPGGPVTQLQGLALRRRRADVLPELPPKKYELRLVEVEGATRRMLDNVTEAAALACGMNPGDIDKVTDIDRLQGLVLNFSRRLEALTEVRVALAAAKIPAVLRRIAELEEEGERIAVYSDHRAPIDALAEVAAGEHEPGHPARVGWKVIRGIESEKQRTAAVDHFRAGVDDKGKPVWGIGFTAAGREGHSLECAVRLLVVSSSWSAASEEQAEDRLCRFGRESEATIERFVAAHPIEIMQQRILAAKRMRSAEALDAGDSGGSVLALPTALTKPQWLSDSRAKVEQDCQFAAHARYDLGLRPSSPPESRRLGVLFHAAIEGRLLSWCETPNDLGSFDSPRARELATQKIKKQCIAEQWAQNKGSTEEDGRTAFELSLRCLSRFGFLEGRWQPYSWQGKPAVELDLRVPLPEYLSVARPGTRFTWAGFVAKIDLIAFDLHHRGGTGQPRLTVVDFKCKENVSEGLSDGADDVQLMRYLAATRLIGMPTELAARIETKNKLPEEPQIVRGGKLSTAKANVVDTETFLAAIARHGHKVEAYADHLAWLKQEGPRLFAMVQCGRTQTALDNVWTDLLYLAVEMQREDKRPIRNLRSQRTAPCQSDRWQCEYKELCTATIPGLPTPEKYGNDLVQLGRMKRSSGHDYQTEQAAITAALED